MDWIQAHLLLNHVPVIGVWIGALVLAWGLARRRDETRRLALGLLALLALSAAPAYLSGSEAEDAAEGLAGVSVVRVSDHESAAGIALAGCVLLGLVGVAVLVAFRRRETIATGWLAGVLALALVCSALLAWTAHLGGEIRHPEIRGAFTRMFRL